MTDVDVEMADYYERRAPHYDAVYARPERQADIRTLQHLIPAALAGRDVLEIAAGTGYWTQFVSATANTVVATDYNPAPLAIAAAREYPKANVRFGRADAFALDRVAGDFTAAFAGFWWSHLRRSDTDRFLSGVCARLRPGSTVVIVDNRYVEGSSQPVTRTDEAGNTFQRRQLPDGTATEILKNFPTATQLREATRGHGSDPDIVELEYYWLLTFTI
ncbi:class I SAM-dependent methyltransferase [Dactylosporangium cerinum]|uniref:Class I SAM-dependent methyltransferase n=1 Tax=Dactylosporangium cerinum TaxID=1434730 RepID=A0ABV9WE24_9ACTN